MAPSCVSFWQFSNLVCGSPVSQVCDTETLSRRVPFNCADRLPLHPVPGTGTAGHSQLLEGPIARLLTSGDQNVHFLARAQGQFPIYLRGPGHFGSQAEVVMQVLAAKHVRVAQCVWTEIQFERFLKVQQISVRHSRTR